jgi:hypothetical protein
MLVQLRSLDTDRGWNQRCISIHPFRSLLLYCFWCIWNSTESGLMVRLNSCTPEMNFKSSSYLLGDIILYLHYETNPPTLFAINRCLFRQLYEPYNYTVWAGDTLSNHCASEGQKVCSLVYLRLGLGGQTKSCTSASSGESRKSNV